MMSGLLNEEAGPGTDGQTDVTTAIVDKETQPRSYTDDQHREIDADKGKDILVVCEDATIIMSKKEILLLNVAWFGLSLMFLLLSVEVVPAQIQSLVGPDSKGRWLGGIVAAGAGVTFITSPIIGIQSDRSTFRFGKRRPIMFLGTISLCIGLLGMAISAPDIALSQLTRGSNSTNGKLQCNKDLVSMRCAPYWNTTAHNPIDENGGAQEPNSIVLQHKPFGSEGENAQLVEGSIGLYIVFYLMVTVSFASITVPYNALIADMSHPTQRGVNSGVMAAMILIGNVSGAGVGTSFTQIGVAGAYAVSISIVIVTLVVTIFSTSEGSTKQILEPVGCCSLICGFWDPLKEHDFRWVFITRFLMQQGVSTVTGFLEFWLHDMVYLPHCWTATTCVAIMLLPLLFAAACSSIVFGVLSDRTQRRKPIVIAAASLMSVSIASMILLNITPASDAFYVGIGLAFLFGIGFGSYQSVDFALLMDVLPDNEDRAKDIAVWQQALVLPNALATPIGGIILDYFQSVNCEIGLGYVILFLVTSVYFCLSGLFVLKLRRAK